MSCSTMMKAQARSGVATVRPRAARASVKVSAVRHQEAPSDLRNHAVAAIAAAALLMSSPVPALAAERAPNNTPLAYSDLPKDGPKINDPGQKQPADGLDTPRSNAKAQEDAAGLSVGRQPAGQPRRISALPSAPQLYEVADLGDAVKSAVGFGRELGDTDSAGSDGAAQRLQESAKENLKGGANQAVDKAVDTARDVADQARRQISAVPSAPRLYEVANLGDAVKSAVGFDRELGDTNSAGSGAGERLTNSAQDALSGGAQQAANKVQGLKSDLTSQAQGAASSVKGAASSVKGAVDRQLQ